MEQNENKTQEKLEYKEVTIEVFTWPYVDVLTVSDYKTPEYQL